MMRVRIAVVVLFTLHCGDDGPNSGVTLSSPTVPFTTPGGPGGDGPNDDGPGDDTAPATGDTTATTSGTTSGTTAGSAEPTTGPPAATSTGASESSDVSTGPVGEPTQVVINFDEWGNSQPVLTDQYADAIFSSEDTCAAIPAQGGDASNTSPPNILWLSSKTSQTCLYYGDLYVDFPSPAYDLVFTAAYVESAGLAGRVRVFQLGVETALIDIIGSGDPTIPIPVDLTLYPGVTRIEVIDTELGTEPGAVKYDDFMFTVFL